MRLSSDLWVGALLRRAELGGAYAMVLRRGDARAGAVLVKVVDRRAGRCQIYTETVNMKGERVWIEPVCSDDEAILEAYADRQAKIDPDLWVVEVDDGQGRHFLTEPIERR